MPESAKPFGGYSKHEPKIKYDSGHRSRRLERFEKAGFLCECKGCKKCAPHDDRKCCRIAEIGDHVIPHRGNRELFEDPDNYQALCRDCDKVKTAKDNGIGDR